MNELQSKAVNGVRTFFSAALHESRGMHEAAYLLAAFAFLSQILALLRDRLLAHSFGAGETLDLYYAAFRIPDFLFAIIASLLSLYALLPVLSKLEREHEALMFSFLRRTLLVFFAAMGTVSAVAFLFAPQLVALAVPGFAAGEGGDTLVLLARILLLQPIFLGASNILANVTQMRHRFLLYSVSPLLYNLGIISGVLFFYPSLGISGLAWGVVLGAALHVAVQVPFFFSHKVERALPSERFLPTLGEVLRLSIPRTATLAAGQLTLLVLIALASLLSAGSISVFMFAWNLQAVPLTIIGVSYSVAAFPTLARLFAAGARSEFALHITGALRHIVFWSIPATVLVIVLRAHIVRAILGSGAFDWDATRLTAAALALFVLALVAQSVSLLIARAYYAAGNTIKPLLLAVLSVGVSVISSLALLSAFQSSALFRNFVESLLRVEDVSGSAVLMLALGYALGPLLQGVLGLFVFRRDFALSLSLGRLVFQSFSAAVIGGLTCYATLALTGQWFDPDTLLGIATQGSLAGVLGLCSTGGMLALLKNNELREIWAALRGRMKDAEPVALEPSDIAS